MTDETAGRPSRGFEPHPLRAAILGEVHARPYRPATTPRLFLHHAFAADRDRLEADRLFLERFCRARGEPGPGPESRHHVVPFGGGFLKWERHAEFVGYTWDGPLEDPDHPFGPLPTTHPFGADFVQPGPLLVSIRLELVADRGGLEADADRFDPASRCVAEAHGGAGLALTDFRQDGDGFTRILLRDRSLNPQQAGALVQRLIEIETYRTLAMLGLPVAQGVAPDVRRIERELAAITAEIRSTTGLTANRGLLERLSGLTADLEAAAADVSWRFGATQAYDRIVEDLLAALHEHHVPGYGTWTNFLARRSGPAMRTVASIQDRMNDLSRKLSRAAQLLRTRVDVDLEQQNRDLLESMNQRARRQLLLQQTVEGLSVAAVSYYVVGLCGYVLKAAKEAHLLPIDPGLATGLVVPVVLLGVFLLVRSIRRKHAPDGEH